MTEGKGKRRFWRPRRAKKKTEGPGEPVREAGAPPQEPSAPDGDAPLQGSLPIDAGAAEPAASAESPGDDAGAAAGPLSGHGAREGSEAGEGGARKGRRRGRRRGKKKGAEPGAPHAADESAAEESPAAAGAGEAAELPEDAGERPAGRPEAVAVEAGELPPVPGEEEAAHGPEEGAGHPHKKRRRRRRGRRRGGNGQPGAAEGQAAAGEAEAEGEAPEFGAAELPETGDEAQFVEGPTAEIEEEEPEEEEVGTGPRRAMMIDGLQPEEIRVAILTEGQLEYFEVENQRKKAFKGNIYKGKVVNVAHAIEAAFVEFGGGRHGFLPLNEYCGGALIENLGSWDEAEKRPHIRPGMELLVQVTKEESSIKGAALTSYISIAGRYLVMMLGMKRYGISKKITGEKERERIRKHMEKIDYPEHLGFIVRTAGLGKGLKDLKADVENLLKLWDRTVEGARTRKAPALLYEEQDIVIRTLRDNYSADVTQVLIDSPESFRKASDFFDIYYPKQKGKLVLYRQKRPLFSKFNLEEQLDRMTARKVPLPSGGHIVIDRSEALWSIDVNSGRSSKDRDIEDTAFRTNREAAVEVARQLRLRDMGGLIVVDFIDMEHRNHNKEVERTLKEHMKRDKAKSDISSLGKFGLVAISRQRMGISFYDVLLKACEHCDGTGSIPTGDTIIVKMMRRLHDELSKEPGRNVVLRVSSLLLEKLINQKREEFTRLEKLCGSRVTVVADPSLPAVTFSVGAAPAT